MPVNDGERFKAPLAHVAPNPLNIREEWEWETDDFEDLADSVEGMGVQQDPTVSSIAAYRAAFPAVAAELGPEVFWVLGAGERRYRAALSKGLTELPMVLRNDQLAVMDELIWTENSMRTGLHPLQEGKLFARFRGKNLTNAEIAERLGKRNEGLSDSAITKKIRLLELPMGPTRVAVGRRELGVDPAYTLLVRYGVDGVDAAFQRMREQNITVKELVAREFPKPAPPAPAASSAAGTEVAAEGQTAAAAQPAAGASTGSPAAAPAAGIPAQGGSSAATATPPVPAVVNEPQISSTKPAGATTEPQTPTPAAESNRLAAAKNLLTAERDTRSRIERLAAAVTARATDAEKHMAAQLLDDYDNADQVLVAEAIAIAAAELRLRAQEPADWTDIQYLHDLEAAGYQPTEAEKTRVLPAGSAHQN
ncbi:ParB N-terminal domain-containing protein [Kitasatospora sp. NPDC002227]|uniref:ParB/RepB/Spo0J family partition protein n=1 Tax=Kitasatospora sp. NPDC002227 TaxID=3154773 RepID=UPI00331EF343